MRNRKSRALKRFSGFCCETIFSKINFFTSTSAAQDYAVKTIRADSSHKRRSLYIPRYAYAYTWYQVLFATDGFAQNRIKVFDLTSHCQSDPVLLGGKQPFWFYCRRNDELFFDSSDAVTPTTVRAVFTHTHTHTHTRTHTRTTHICNNDIGPISVINSCRFLLGPAHTRLPRIDQKSRVYTTTLFTVRTRTVFLFFFTEAYPTKSLHG